MSDDSLFLTQRADGANADRRHETPGDPVVKARVRWVFWIAAGYGLVALLPMYFKAPAELSHPHFYYGFIGVASAWQVAFLLVAQDPYRFRLVILPAILEKLGFGVAALVLFAQDRSSVTMAAAGALDLVFAALFVWCFVMLSRSRE